MFVAFGDGRTSIMRRMHAWAACAVCVLASRAHAQSPPQFYSPPPGSPPANSPLENVARPPASDAEPQGIVAEVRVEGNETISAQKVLNEVRTRQDRAFDAELVQADVRKLLRNGRFADVRTFTQPAAGGGVIVTFQVVEHPTIRDVKFIGNRALTEKSLTKQAGLKKGDPLDSYNIEEARRRIEDFYHSKGYPKAVVTIAEGANPNDRRAVFMISEGNPKYIASVRFVGNDPSLATDARLKTIIKSKPGFLYLIGGAVDESKIEEDAERLTAYYRRLGYFRAVVSRELDYDGSGRWLTLTFVINEGPRYVVRNVSVLGAERFTTDQLMAQLKLESGAYFDQVKMLRDENTLRDIYGGHGYVFADISAQPRFLEEPGYLDVVYRVSEGQMVRVGNINVHIEGEYPHTRHSTVLNRLEFRPGEIIDLRKVRSSERRLQASQLFVTNPQEGEPPRIAVQPLQLQDSAESIADERQNNRGAPAYRGQSPDDLPPPRTARPHNVDVHVTPLRSGW